jgi:hypothetical protein
MGAGDLAATTGVHGQKMPWWLTCGPSAPFNLIHFFQSSNFKIHIHHLADVKKW